MNYVIDESPKHSSHIYSWYELQIFLSFEQSFSCSRRMLTATRPRIITLAPAASKCFECGEEDEMFTIGQH